jgi:hypothetical protein
MRRHVIAIPLLLAGPAFAQPRAQLPEARCEAMLEALNQVYRATTSMTLMLASVSIEPIPSPLLAEGSLRRFEASQQQLGQALVEASLRSKEAADALRKECGR